MNNELNLILNDIKKDILIKFPFLKSIYLIGSFGRDEGSYIITNGELRIYNDIDFVGIIEDTDKHLISDFEISLFNGKYAKKLNIPFFDFNILTKSTILNQEPSIQSYDFKYGSKLIYGYDYSKEYRIEVSYLPKFEFIRLLLNRSAGLLTGKFHNTSKEYNIIQTYKAYIAIGDALLFYIDGFYDSKYNLRMQRFLEQKNKILGLIDESSYQQIINSYLKKINYEYFYETTASEKIHNLLIKTIYLYQNFQKNHSLRSLFFNLLTSYTKSTVGSFYTIMFKNLLKQKPYLTSKMILFLLIFTLKKDKYFLDTLFYSVIIHPFLPKTNSKERKLTTLWFNYCH